MSRLFKIFKKVALSGVLLLAVKAAHATDIAYSGTFVGTEGLASVQGQIQAANYTRNFNTTGDRVTLQVVASSYTVAVSTNFGSGQYVLNTPTITIVGNNFTQALPVLLTTATVTISGLTNQTTYYISVINPNTNGVSNTFKLSLTSTGAVAGVGIVLASSSTVTNRFTLAPLAFTNTTGGIQLQASNDNSNFVNLTTGNYGLAITSVTFSSSGNNTLWDLGPIQYKYLRLKESPPTTGGVNYTVTSNERYSYGH